MPTLISGYLERIKSSIFDDYHGEITSLIGKRHGVYALYKKDKLYYVGLASNLRSRVKQHLKDRHANKWDRFSLYLIRNIAFLKELEALILHIAEPKGNMQKGKLGRGNNFEKALYRLVVEHDKERQRRLFSKSRPSKLTKKKTVHAPKGLILHRLLFPGTPIKAKYKGREVVATIDEQGRINLNGKQYDSPSSAGLAVIDSGAVNGWRFWRYQNPQGKWVFINELLKR